MTAPPVPRANPHLIGHTGAEQILRNAAESHRLHHAWLLTGPEGVGKATLAFRFARALLAGFPGPGLQVPPSHPVFASVAAATHPDLVTVARGWDDRKQRAKSEIPIDDTRALTELFSMTPAAGGWRIVVVLGADSLNKNAANALLKLLEEPPNRAVFLLTSARPNLLSPTIRSRCACLRLRPLDDRAMLAALRDLLADLPEDQRAGLIETSAGSPGKAARRHLSADATAGPAERLSAWQSAFHRNLIEAAGTGRTTPARAIAIERSCEAWGSLLRLSAATEKFNLDRQQLDIEAAREIAR